MLKALFVIAVTVTLPVVTQQCVTVDEKGNVYIVAGQVVYDASGHLIDTIDVPDRPSQLRFGGSDGKTLFILARSSLYAVQTRYKGR